MADSHIGKFTRWPARQAKSAAEHGARLIGMLRGTGEPGDHIPAGLRQRLSAFPITAPPVASMYPMKRSPHALDPPKP